MGSMERMDTIGPRKSVSERYRYIIEYRRRFCDTKEGIHLSAIKRTPADDKRTRAGRENEVIEQVNTYGGFSVFWITAYQARALAAERLVMSGAIVVTPRQYPWISAVHA